jgi:hypothetical protein
LDDQRNENIQDDESDGYRSATSFYQKPTDAEFARYMLENEDNIKQRVLHLQGWYQDENGTLRQVGEPLLNEEGVRFANRQMRHFTGKYGALANMDESRISKFTLYHDKMIRRCLLTSLKHYSPNGRMLPISTISEVKATIVDPGYLNLTRSSEDLERQRVYKSHNVVESHQYDNTPPEKKRRGIVW